jgi:hypothetical protein
MDKNVEISSNKKFYAMTDILLLARAIYIEKVYYLE